MKFLFQIICLNFSFLSVCMWRIEYVKDNIKKKITIKEIPSSQPITQKIVTTLIQWLLCLRIKSYQAKALSFIFYQCVILDCGNFPQLTFNLGFCFSSIYTSNKAQNNSFRFWNKTDLNTIHVYLDNPENPCRSFGLFIVGISLKRTQI